MNLRIATSHDLENPKDRRLFRFFEILPGAISWLTILLAIFFSWQQPFLVAIFILIFDIYWFFRGIYFAFHLHSSYKKMQEHQKTDWLGKLKEIPDWQKLYHLCLFTVCNEPLKVIKDAFQTLIDSDYPKDKMIIVLSAEEKYRQETESSINTISKEFSGKFFKFLVTWHPAGLPGEIAGKGSNDNWAGKRAKEDVVDLLNIPYENIVVSFFDTDTCIFPKYFSCLSWYYLKAKDPTKTSFQPIPLFINNIWEAPIFSRTLALSSTFWNTLSQERPEKLVTFSSHAMSFKAMVDVGFKQPNVVSDDSRIFWLCYLKYNSNYSVQPIYYPISMDANVSDTVFKTAVSIYKQQRRWAYGADEIPYVFFNFLKNKEISLKKKLSQGFFLFESHWSWATNSLLLFILGWLPIALGGDNFSQTLIAHNLPHLTSRIMTITMIGLLSSIYLSFSLFSLKPKSITKLRRLTFVVEWLILPLGMIFFSALPALEAQTILMLGKPLPSWATKKVRKA